MTHMKQHIIIFISIIILTTITVSGCATQPEATDPQNATITPDKEDDMLMLTLEELSAFDGKDGALAYIAIDGDIYDVTKVRQWIGGIHNKEFVAGKDYSNEVRLAPHGIAKIVGIPIVGKLVE